AGVRGRTDRRRRGALVHAVVQTGAQGPGTRVLSNNRYLGQSHRRADQERGRPHGDCGGAEIMSTVAAIQMTSGHSVEGNLEAAGKLLREAKEAGAELACLPENFSFIGLKDADKLGVAEADGSGPVQQFFSETARPLGLWILGGTTVTKGASARRVSNSSLLFDAQGKRVARYDKIHLFDVTIPGRNEQYLESTHVTPGRKVVVAARPVGPRGV